MDSYREQFAIPPSLAWDSQQMSAPEESFVTDWIVSESSDRVLTRNYGRRVVVCAPLSGIPTVERSAPIFTHLSVRMAHADVDQLEEVIEAINTHLDTSDPCEFYYGVRHHETQAFSNTPARFLEDVEKIHRYTDHEQPTVTRSATGQFRSQPGFTAAALWPVRYGWFYFEGNLRNERSEPTWTYGLLLREPMVDPSMLMPFFEALTDHPPRVQHQWPFRRIQASGTAGSPLAHVELLTDELVASDSHGRPELCLLGTNPFYATDLKAIDTFPRSVPNALYKPLQRTSSFLYRPTIAPQEDDEPNRRYAVDEIIVVQPPGTNSTYVAASATRAK